MNIEIGKTYRDPKCHCTLTILKENNRGEVSVRISNRERVEVLKRGFLESLLNRGMIE